MNPMNHMKKDGREITQRRGETVAQRGGKEAWRPLPEERLPAALKEKGRREGSGRKTGFQWLENPARSPRRVRGGVPGGEDGGAHFVAAAVEGGVVGASGLRGPEREEEHAALGAEFSLGAGGVPALGETLRREDDERAARRENGVSAGFFARTEEGPHARAAGAVLGPRAGAAEGLQNRNSSRAGLP